MGRQGEPLSTISELYKRVHEKIEVWRNRPIEGEHPYVYLDGIVLKRSWAGEILNVSVLVAMSVGQNGFRQALGIDEGHKEDRTAGVAFSSI